MDRMTWIHNALEAAGYGRDEITVSRLDHHTVLVESATDSIVADADAIAVCEAAHRLVRE